MRPLLIALLLLAGGNVAGAGERSFGFIHVDGKGGVSQSLRADRVAVSGGSRRADRDRSFRRGDDRRDRSATRRAYRDIERSGARFYRHGSFLYAGHSVNPTDRPYIPALDDVAYGGSGTYSLNSGASDNGGGGYWQEKPAARFPSEPKIINIEAERLDRRSIGPSGIEVIQNGGAKIIRIAPGYGESAERHASATRPAEPRATGRYLQPWSEAWMRHCIKAFPSFNPELGTYADARGTIRFCTADE